MEWEDYFNKYKNRVLNAAIVIIAVIISFNIYKIQHLALESLKNQKENEIKKSDILGSISQSDERLKSYKVFLNKKDISLTLDNIANIAQDSNAKIVSVKPVPEQAYPTYIKYSFNLVINISDYQTLGKFISKLENSYDVYMMETFSIIPQFADSERRILKGLLVNLKVNTFLYKD